MNDYHNLSAGNDCRSAGETTEAIVLAPAGSEPLVLRGLLSQPAWRVTAQSDPVAAMAAVAVAETGRLTRDTWELGDRVERGEHSRLSHVPHVTFVLVQPRIWPEGRELLEAIATYFPKVATYTLDDNGLKPLSGSRPPTPVRRRTTSLSIEPRSSNSNSASPGSDRPTLPRDGAITSEELDMLLDGSTLRDGGRP